MPTSREDYDVSIRNLRGDPVIGTDKVDNSDPTGRSTILVDPHNQE